MTYKTCFVIDFPSIRRMLFFLLRLTTRERGLLPLRANGGKFLFQPAKCGSCRLTESSILFTLRSYLSRERPKGGTGHGVFG